MANLASVLGGPNDGMIGCIYKSGANKNMDTDFAKEGNGGITMWTCPTTTTGLPLSSSYGFALQIQRYAGLTEGTQEILQIYLPTSTKGDVYLRIGFVRQNNVTWNEWKNLTNY